MVVDEIPNHRQIWGEDEEDEKWPTKIELVVDKKGEKEDG